MKNKISDCIILIRQHPFFDSPLKFTQLDRIIFVNEENLFLLFSVADIVISSPSSIVEQASAFTNRIIIYKKPAKTYDDKAYEQIYHWAKFVDLREVEHIYKTIIGLLSTPSYAMISHPSDIKEALNRLYERIEEDTKIQKNRIKVAFIAHGPNQINGPNVWLQRFLPELVKFEIQPHVIFLMNSDDPCEVLKNLRQKGIECTIIQRQRYTEQNILLILKIFQDKPPDVFVPNLSVPAYFAARWIKKAGIPTVGILHSDDNFHHELIEYFVNGLTEYRLSGIVCVSKFLEEQVKFVNNKNIEVLWCPYGINIPHNIAEEPLKRLNLVYTGRLIQRQKRIFDVVTALKNAVTNIPDTYASIYGEDREGGKVIQTINNLNLGERLRYGGLLKIDEIFQTLLKHHVFVLLSDYEGMPISLLEAMGCGLVPVCTRTRSGTMEIIRHNENGLLVDDREDDFINAIKRLRYEKGLWLRLSKAARETVEKEYTIQTCAKRWAEFLAKLVEQSPLKNSIRVPDVKEINLPPVKISENGICREDKRIPKTPVSNDNFLNPQCIKENMDFYLVRSSILQALKEFLPQCKGTFLDVGCGKMPYKQLILQNVKNYIGLDIENPVYQKIVKPDIFWDGKHIPLSDNSVDCAMATELFEHLPDIETVLKEIRRVLKPGGKIFFTVPFLWPLHDMPNDEYRYTPVSLQRHLRNAGFNDIQIRAQGGWDASLAQMIGLWLKRRPMSEEKRREFIELLFPFYKELVEMEKKNKLFDYDEMLRENIMITGLTGTATKPLKQEPISEKMQGEIEYPICSVTCDSLSYLANQNSNKQGPLLAIVVPVLGVISETFIRRHIEYLLPDRTVILTYKIVDPTWAKCPIKLIPPTYGGTKYSPQVAEEIVKFLRHYRVTHILSEYGAENSGIVELNRQHTKLPIFIHFHGYDASQELRKPAIVSYYRWMGSYVNGVIAVSKPMAKRLINAGIPESKIKIIHYGIEPPENVISKPEKQLCRFVCVSRLVAKKGLIYLLQAFKKAYSEVPDITLDIVGEGPMRGKIESFIAEHRLSHVVRLHGQKPNSFVSDLLDESSAYIQHSITDPETGDAEGLPNSILEAASHGLPIISTFHEGIPEAVQHGITGFLVEEFDIKKMAEYMVILARDGELRRKLGLKGREKIITEDFTVDTMIQSLREFMELTYTTAPSELITVNQKLFSKTQEKLISICIPTYNRAGLIRDAIDSVLAQEYIDYEILVVDDGSTDETANIISRYRDNRIRYIRKEHSGAPATRNRCIAEARGEYIVWLDSDDVLLPGTLQTYAKAIEENPDVDVLYGDLIVTDAHLNNKRTLTYRDWYGRSKDLISSLINENPVPNPGVMVKKDCYKRFGNYDESFTRAHDYEFWSRIAGKAIFKHVGKVVAKWRMHDSNWAGGRVKVDFSYEARVIKKILERYSMQEIYPDIDWTDSKNKAEAIALSRISKQLMKWGDLSSSILYLQKSQVLFPTAEKEKMLQDLKLKVDPRMRILRDNQVEDKESTCLNKKRLTITYLISSILGVTGGNQTLINQANALIDRGHNVYIITYSEKPDYFTIKANIIHVPRGEPMSNYVPKSDVVISTYFTNTKELTRIDAPVKIYYAQGDQFIFEDETIQLSPEKERKRRVFKELSKASYLLPGIKFVANSHNLANAVEKVYGRKADAVLPVCVDSSIFHPLPNKKKDGPVRILVVGPDTLGSEMEPLIFKGIADIRKALDKLSSKRNDFVVVRMSNSEFFIFKDFKCEFHIMPDNKMKTFLYGTADILVYASHYDSCPRPPLEAMSSGAAVVCTETSGALEYCRNGENCLLVPIKSPDLICEAIERLMDDKELREKLIKGGFETARIYPQEREWNELEDLLYRYYYEVIKPKSIVKDLTSIIIVLNNDHECTKRSIQSIEDFTTKPYEVILVSNNSKTKSARVIKDFVQAKKNYKFIEADKDINKTKSRNHAIEASSGEYILLLNNNVVVTDGWLSRMLECLNSSPDVGVVGPMTNNIDGIQNIYYDSVYNLDEFARKFKERNMHRRIYTNRIAGLCMLFRRELIDKIGLLDETLGDEGFEYDDFCLRAVIEGYKNLIAGDVFIFHDGVRSFKKNKKVFKKKWSGIDSKSLLGKKLLIFSALEDAEILNHKGKIDVAVSKLLDEIKHAPTEKRLYYALSELLIDINQFKDAYELLKGMTFVEYDLKRLELLGYCSEGLESYSEAEEYAERILSFNPSSALALNLKGILAHKRGDDKEAEEFFDKAIKADPGFGEPYTNKGVLMWAAGRQEEALDLLEKGCILSPTVGDIVNLYHSAVSTLSQFERAEKVFQEAQSLYPLNRRITFLLIDILLQHGKYDLAMREIEKAMVIFDIEEGMLSAALKVRDKLGPRKIKDYSKSSLSLCMIVKNEESYIAQCLLSVAPVVDEMIIVDTGSTDRTKDIAKAFGAKVYDFHWTNNFAEARNYSLDHANGDWILVLDADEVISSRDHRALTELIKKKKMVGYSFTTRNYTVNVNTEGWVPNDGRYEKEEAADGWFQSRKVRLFPRDPRIMFENHVHELVEPSLRKAGIEIKRCDIPIHHYGRLNKERDILKEEIYYELGKTKLQEKGDDIQALSELAVTAGTVGKYEEAIELWQKVISIKPDFVKAYINLGYIYLQIGRFEDALAISKKAVELAPDHKESLLNYASSEIYSGDIKKAILTLENLLNKIPEFPPAIGVLAVAYIIEGERDKGIENILKIKKLGYNCPEFIYKQAKTLISAGRSHYAIPLLEIAIDNGFVNDDITLLFSELKTVNKCEA
ncbi:MAG: glycosyltransferase [Thermodesulfovibrionales bacterium]